MSSSKHGRVMHLLPTLLAPNRRGPRTIRALLGTIPNYHLPILRGAGIGRLRSRPGTTPSRTSSTPTPACMACVRSSWSTLAASPLLALEPAASAAASSRRSAASGVVVATSIGVGLGPALLDDDGLAVDHVRVRGNRGIVACLCLELDEGAVLVS